MANKKKTIFITSVSFLILLGHSLLGIYDYPLISINVHWQLPSQTCLQETPFKALFYTDAVHIATIYNCTLYID